MCVCEPGVTIKAELSFLQELQRYVSRQRQQEADIQGAEVRQPMVLRYPMPYPQDPSPPPLVPQRPAELQYGNPYSTDTTRGEIQAPLNSLQLHRCKMLPCYNGTRFACYSFSGRRRFVA